VGVVRHTEAGRQGGADQDARSRPAQAGVIQMPLESWIQHSRVDQFLYDWQTFIAGVLAVLAAVGTIWATISSANREIAASQAQTAVAQKQIDTTLRLERERVLNEDRAFRGMLAAAMTRVIAEAQFARETYATTFTAGGHSSREAFAIRNCITKGAFAELRAACLRQGSPLTWDFLDLEREIDSFALQCEDQPTPTGAVVGMGKHAGLGDQLALIETKATALREKAERIE
jgi:hypothetical protein